MALPVTGSVWGTTGTTIFLSPTTAGPAWVEALPGSIPIGIPIGPALGPVAATAAGCAPTGIVVAGGGDDDVDGTTAVVSVAPAATVLPPCIGPPGTPAPGDPVSNPVVAESIPLAGDVPTPDNPYAAAWASC